MPLPLHRRAALVALTAVALAFAPLRAAAEGVLVFAAASLTGALDAVAADWTNRTGQAVTVSYAGSAALAAQIRQGAPADIFISASRDWMDVLDQAGELRPGTRHDILGNRLVLIAHGRGVPPVQIDPSLDLPGMLAGGRLSMALVEAVPAGIYGRQALEALGLWDGVAPHVAQSDNVRAALAFVALGEAPLGVVYATDAAAADNVTVIGTFPQGSHDPIVYPAAITAEAANPEAQAFLDHLTANTARAIWARHGFVVPD